MKTSHCHEQAQGLLFDIMPDHNREVDDLEYCAMPCGAAKTARLIRRGCSLCYARELWPNNGMHAHSGGWHCWPSQVPTRRSRTGIWRRSRGRYIRAELFSGRRWLSRNIGLPTPRSAVRAARNSKPPTDAC